MDAGEAVKRTGSEVAERLVVDGALRARLMQIAWERFGIDRATAEDLLQETAVVLLRTSRLIESPDGFAYRVFYVRCCHHIERLACRRQTLRQNATAPVRPARDVATDLDLGLALKQGISRLSATCQELLRRHYREGKSYEEVARELEKANRSISTLMSRCVDRLRRLVSCQRG